MTKQFVRHVRNAQGHLEEAVASLKSGDLDETIVSLRCVLVEIECAKARPVAGHIERSMLHEIEQAALTGELLVRQVMQPDDEDQTRGNA